MDSLTGLHGVLLVSLDNDPGRGGLSGGVHLARPAVAFTRSGVDRHRLADGVGVFGVVTLDAGRRAANVCKAGEQKQGDECKAFHGNTFL